MRLYSQLKPQQVAAVGWIPEARHPSLIRSCGVELKHEINGNVGTQANLVYCVRHLAAARSKGSHSIQIHGMGIACRLYATIAR